MPLSREDGWWEVEGAELTIKEPLSLSQLELLEVAGLEDDPGLEMNVTSATKELLQNFRNGRVKAQGLAEEGEWSDILADRWTDLKIQGDTDLLDIVVSNTGGTPVLYSDIRILSEPLSRLWNPREGNTSIGGRFEFDQTARWWTLFQAALWVGCEGQELDTNQIAGEALDDKGANLLFEALNRQSSLKATGIAREMIREDIPAEYWELATTNPNEPGHYVSFIDDAAGTYWGTLTPAGEHEPHWNRINIDSKALKRIFPFGKAKPVSCQKWLEEIMRGSPNERPKRKYDYLPECKERFGVSKTGFERAWREALDKVPEAKPNWTKGGRPKKTFELIPPPNKSPSPI